MSYATEDITRTLKEARERKGFSQRELAAQSGVRQYQISKFENGTTDLRVSSLIELARALDLELILVPRKSVPAVKTIVRGTEPGGGSARAQAELARWLSAVNDRAHENPQASEYAQMQRYLRDLEHFRLPEDQAGELRSHYKKWMAALNKEQDEKSVQATLSYLQHLRNRLVHGIDRPDDAEFVKPAYSLDEDSDG